MRRASLIKPGMSDVIQDTCVSLSVHTFLEVKHMYEFLIDNIFVMFDGRG
jgi:hypothetical protein